MHMDKSFLILFFDPKGDYGKANSCDKRKTMVFGLDTSACYVIF